MATVALPRTAVPRTIMPRGTAGRLERAARDGLVLTERNLIGIVRTPDALFFLTLQPIMFVLLFRYVFGGAIKVPGLNYVDYMMPGIFVQTAAFGSVSTAIGLADDLQKGLIERFRSLPMARSAVLLGRGLADVVRGIMVIAVMTAVGFAVGFRPLDNVATYLAAVGLLLLFLHCLSWGFSVIGLTAPNSETAQVMAFPVLFPLTFASSAFVPVASMPSWLQVFARNQPLSQVINATRALMLGGPTEHYLWVALAWCAGLLIVLAPIAVSRYRRIA